MLLREMKHRPPRQSSRCRRRPSAWRKIVGSAAIIASSPRQLAALTSCRARRDRQHLLRGLVMAYLLVDRRGWKYLSGGLVSLFLAQPVIPIARIFFLFTRCTSWWRESMLAKSRAGDAGDRGQHAHARVAGVIINALFVAACSCGVHRHVGRRRYQLAS